MATRLYFPLRQPISPVMTPSADGSWNYTSEVTRFKTGEVPDDIAGAAVNGTQIGPWTATAGQKAVDRQFISAPLAAQSISGTVKGQLFVKEIATTDNVDQILVAIKVVSNDGGTVRATLLTLGSYSTTAEFSSTGRNKTIADGDSLGSYTCIDGDRLLIELGYTNTTSATTPEATGLWGGGNSDLPENETQTTVGNPWLEFSGTISWSVQGIQLESIQSAQGSAASSLTVAHTIGANGTNRLLVVAVSNSNATPAKTVTGITYNSVALTQHSTGSNAGGDMKTDFWYLVAPATGTHNIVVTFSASTDEIGVTSFGFYNADQTTPIRDTSWASGNANSSTVAIDSAVGDIVVGVTYLDQTVAPTAGQTLLTQELNIGGFRVQASETVDGSASSTNSTWTHSAVKYVTAGFSVPVANQTVSPTAIATAEAFGTAVITPGAVTITPTAIASAEAFGTLVVTLGAVTVSPTAIASAEVFGTVTMTPGPVTVSPSSIASTEAFGTVAVTMGAVTVSPDSIASAEAFGTVTVTVAAAGTTVSPSSITSAEVFGTLSIRQGFIYLTHVTNAPDKAVVADNNFSFWDTQILHGTGTLDFPNLTAQTTADLTLAVGGARVGDGAIVCPPASPAAGVIFQGWVSADDEVTVRATNLTTGSINPASATFQVVVLKY